MIEIPIGKSIKVAGFDVALKDDKEATLKMHDECKLGRSHNYLRAIELDGGMPPQGFSATFIHELLHQIDDVFFDSALSEQQVNCVAAGFHQVLEQYGIRFVRNEGT